MSVVGIDFGNLNSVVAVARKRGIDVIANEASKRETATVIGFRDDHRTMGEKANSQLTSNINNSVTNFKRLLGQSHGTPETQSELQKLFCNSSAADDKRVSFDVEYQGETKSFSPEQITAMMMTQLKKTVEADSNNQIKLQEVVVSIPPYFTDSNRKALKDSFEIAGINCVQLLSEPLAVAIPWAMYKKDLPEDSAPLNVLFVNFGESTLWASMIACSKTKISVLSCSSDSNLGGRDLDQILVDYFIEVIKTEYKMDVSKSKRAILRLRTQCQKVKKVLTTNPESPLFVESIMNDVDVRSTMKRDIFEELAKPLLERASLVIKKAIEESGVTDINAVEVVGGASYVLPFQTQLKEQTKVETLSHTQNKSEAVARGCALQCAIISPQFHINSSVTFRDYNPYSIKITWTEDTTDGKKTKSAVLFKKGCALNTAKKLTFTQACHIEISADYSDETEFPFTMDNLHIAKYDIPAFVPTVTDPSKPATVEVMFKIDASGIFYMKHANAVELYTEVEKKEVKKADATPATTPATTTEAPKEGEEKKDDATAPTDADTPTPDAAATPAATEAPKEDVVMEEVTKEKKKSTNITVTTTYANGYTKEKLAELKKLEAEMFAADELVIATDNARNAMESFAYETQGKLQYDGSEWVEFATEEEKAKILEVIEGTLAWLYGGEGDSATKDEFLAKLTELMALSSPIALRKSESELREPTLKELRESITFFRDFVNSIDEKFAHIESDKRDLVTEKIKETEEWINKMTDKQNALPSTQSPVLLSSEIENKKRALITFATPIVNTPAPKPKVEEEKKDCKDDTCCSEKTCGGDAKPTEGDKTTDATPEGDKMDTEPIQVNENPTEIPAPAPVAEEMDLD